MPIVHHTNNMVGPANDRSVDVARRTIQQLLPVQNRRYDNAFRVQGFQALLYHRLNHGEKCLCSSKDTFLGERLGLDGKASAGAINSLLADASFENLPYGSRPSRTASSVLEVDLNPAGRLPSTEIAYPASADLTARKLPSIFETDDPDRTARGAAFGSITDRYASDSGQAGSTTILPDGMGVNGPVSVDEHVADIMESSQQDLGIHSGSDQGCPICFGSGFVGGYSLYNGLRIVLVPNKAERIDGALVLVDSIPYAESVLRCDWKVRFPLHAVSVDTVKIWNKSELAENLKIYVDSTEILSELQLLNFCDGREHTLSIQATEESVFSHVEIQFNSSKDWVNFEFPKLTKSSNQTVLENTDPFSVIVSPMVPRISPLDIVYETSYGKFFMVKSVPTWNTQGRSVLGWEAELRPLQPQEMATILPKRLRLEAANRPAFQRTNLSGHRIS